MATMITSECINCGACEPECPNNAISQGEEIYVIDPLLCTECVGFHDYEACAAVCPVDCCVTDPNNIENEEVLIARAREIHKDVSFGENFESRFRKAAEKPVPAEQPSVQKPAQGEIRAAPAPSLVGQKPEERPKPAPPPAPSPKPETKQTVTKPAAQAPKPVRPEKHFPGELSVSFKETLVELGEKGPLTRMLPRLVVFFLQTVFGALPHQFKKDLEGAVKSPVFFSTSGATGLNILCNMILYPFGFMVGAALVERPDVLFSQKINLWILVGLLLGFLEGAYRLREGLFHAKPAAEMSYGAALYGIPLSYLFRPLMAWQLGIIRALPIPVDGFYEKGFVEKMERERRYGNIYTLQDLGDAYFLRVEFPRKVPDIGLAVRSELPDEMPDYDYDLLLKDGHFIVKGRCVDERVRKISASVGAFPPEFTTVIPLQERVVGFCHRFENKLLEVLLLKEGKHRGRESSHL